MTGVHVTQSLLDAVAAGDRRPLRNARIGWHNHGWEAAWSATSTAPDHPAAALANALTVRRWRASAGGEQAVTAELSAGAPTDYVAIAAHNLVGAAVTVEVASPGGVFEEVAAFTATNREPIMVLFDSLSVDRVRVTGDQVAPVEIGVVYFGEVLEMQRSIYGGHTPLNLARRTTTVPRRSESGQFLGKTRIRRGYSSAVQWRHLKADWYREHFDPFVEAATKQPFFVAWNPARFPDEGSFCWTDDNIAPSNMGLKDYMQVGFSLEGFRE